MLTTVVQLKRKKPTPFERFLQVRSRNDKQMESGGYTTDSRVSNSLLEDLHERTLSIPCSPPKKRRMVLQETGVETETPMNTATETISNLEGEGAPRGVLECSSSEASDPKTLDSASNSSVTAEPSSKHDIDFTNSVGTNATIDRSYDQAKYDSSSDEDEESGLQSNKKGRSMETTFQSYYEQLKMFKDTFGHTKVTPKYDKKLAGYCAEIRNAKRHPDAKYGRKFRGEHFKAFDDLGFVWNPKKEGDEKSFEFRIQQLKAFKMKHGHVRPTKKYDSNLAHFCANIRKARRNPERAIRITEERIEALDKIGFEWDPKPTQGDINFWSHVQQLNVFRKKHGHSLVTHKHDKKLAVFCNNLRVARRGSSATTRRLNEDRIRALDELDFVWEPGIGKTAADFADMLEQLKEFKRTHGHFYVTPQEGSQKLTDFCTKMRIAFNNPGAGLTSADRIRILDDIGFDWEPKHNDFFDACFEKLKTIHDAGGDISEAERLNSDLARFGRCMRSAHRHIELTSLSIATSIRMQEMEDIGFKWIF